MVCVAVMVLIGSIAASAAFADPSTTEGGSAFDAFAASSGSLADATAGAIPITTPEPSGTDLAPQELEALGRPEAEGVLEEVFGSSIEGPAQALDELNVEEFRSDHVAVVAPPVGSGQSPSGLISSVLPLRAENDHGEKEMVDLDLEGVDGHLEPENPLVAVEIPGELSEGITFPESGIAINVASSQGQRDSSLAGDASAFFPNVANNSDLVITPTALGVETYTQLRSTDSPHTQSYSLDLPADLHLRATDEGGAEVVNGNGHPVLTVPPPSAVDAEGNPVPADLEVEANAIRVSVEPSPEAAFPVLVDPVFERYTWGTFPQPAGTSGLVWSEFSNQGFWTTINGPKPGQTAEAEQGATSPGNQAYYNYYVPRYWRDIQNGLEKPTSYIRDMKLWGLTFNMPMENAPYGSDPFMYVGLWDGYKNAFVSYGARYGSEGQATDVNWVYDLSNPNEVVDAKQGGFGIATRTSYNNNFRYVNDQQASVEVTDQDWPGFGEIFSVPTWVSSASGPAINYKLTDPGLGIHEIRLKYPAAGGGTGEAITYPGATTIGNTPCTGAADLPCPRTVTQSATPISYNPAQIAQGENWVQIYGVDPVGHWSPVGESRIKVDRTAPELELSGSLTEQGKLGTQQASYTLNYSAKDGDEAAAAATTPIGTVGTAEGQIQRPLGAAVDGNGNLWITDSTNNRVVEYDKTGAFIRQIGTATGAAGSAAGQFNVPKGIAVAPNGTVWVADYGNKRLEAFTPQGAFIRQITSFEGTPFEAPYAVAVAKDGSVWVSDITARKIRHFSEAGSYLGTAAGAPTGTIQSLAIDSYGNIWANDYENNKIYELTSTGASKFSFGGTEGTASGQFKNPVGLAIASSGNVFVADDKNNRIQEFKPDGSFIRTFGAEGSANNQLKEPRLLAVGPGNTLYVADAGNKRIARWTHADRHVESGVTKTEVKVDGVVQKTENPGCAAGKNCSLTGSWAMNADVFPVGKHKVEVLTTDGVGLTTTKALEVETHGDLTAPQVVLSGSLTEQAALGSTLPAYTLSVSATDSGSASERSSGVASSVIKVDGTVSDSYTPGCSAGGCAFVRNWTFKASNYAVGSHSVQVLVTDAAGHTTTKTVTVTVGADTSVPDLQAQSQFYTAPEGWVEQKSYSYNATAADPKGYGVTSLTLKIDGALVKEKAQSCPLGGCSLEFGSTSLNMLAYRGGEHHAELIAVDGAGNTRKKAWTIRVDPLGVISPAESEDTIDALEETAGVRLVSPVAPSEELEGSVSDAAFEEGEFEFISSGTAAPTIVDGAASNRFSVEVPPESAFALACEGAESEGATESPTAQEEEYWAEHVSIACGATLPSEEELEPVLMTPVTTAEAAAAPMLAASDAATIGANYRSQVDLVTRPLFDGALTFAAIRDETAPTTFSWQVHMESDQELRLLDPQHAAVDYQGGHQAFSIQAIAAHDAIGTAVPTSLSVSGDVLTLTVEHHAKGPNGEQFVYPVVGGAGWEGGFQTYQVQMPPPELPEGSEEEAEEVSFSFEEGPPNIKIATVGPPMAQASNAPADNLQPTTVSRKEKAFKFTYCVPHNIPGDPIFDGHAADSWWTPGARSSSVPETEGQNLPKIISECHREDFEGVYWGVTVHGKFHYIPHHWVWAFDQQVACDKWGAEQPAKVHCKALVHEAPHGNVNAVVGPLDVIGEYRFAEMKGQWVASQRAACFTLGGKLYPNGRSTTGPYERPMIWNNEYVIPKEQNCQWW